MKGLNKIFKDVDKIRDKFLMLDSKNNSEINNIFNGILQMYEAMNYENKRGNTKRLNLNNNDDVPIESLLVVINDMLNKFDSINHDDFIGFLSVVEAKLQQIEGEIKPTIKSINKILKKEPF